MHSGVNWGSDAQRSAPLTGDNSVRRPLSTLKKRQSAPPRPLRHSLAPIGKAIVQECIIDISDVHASLSPPPPPLADHNTIEIPISAYDFAKTDPVLGRVSPVSQISEEPVSSSESYSSTTSLSSHVSRSKSLKRVGHLEWPQQSLLRRRPFSFESLRSAVSNYDQQPPPALKPEQLQVPYKPAAIYDEYAEIAMANPYGIVSGPLKAAMTLYEPSLPYDIEPSRRSSVAMIMPPLEPSSPSVPLSRYNSQRAPPPTPDHEEAQRQLDEAWEEVKKAIAPKLKVAAQSPPRNSSLSSSSSSGALNRRMSTQHALPPSPPPPPVPARNPRRAHGGHPQVAELDSRQLPSKRLHHSTSSPSIARSYSHHRQASEEYIPPVPALPAHVPIPIVASNLPIHRPAPLPTPATSDCSAQNSPSSSPPSYSPLSQASPMQRAHSRFSGSTNSSVPSLPSPISEQFLNGPTYFSEHQSRKSVISPLSSPTGRGFHEPPPVAPTLGSKPKRVSGTIGHEPRHSRGWSDPRVVTTTSIWAGPAPPVSYMDVREQVARSNTLASVRPGESATRESYQAPVRPEKIRHQRGSILPESGGGRNNFFTSPNTSEDFAPIKVTPVPEKLRTKAGGGEHLPRHSNNYAGFCKGAWRLQTSRDAGAHNKAFSLRTVSRKATLPNSTTTTTKTTTLRCAKCSFEGPLARHPATLSSTGSYAPFVDYLACAEKTPKTAHGVIYRWSFLFKSHVSCRTSLRKDAMVDPEAEVYACLFCCAEGRGTACFKGAKTLCGHIAKEHGHGVDLNAELKQRVAIIVARQPLKNEDWDVILPGRIWI